MLGGGSAGGLAGELLGRVLLERLCEATVAACEVEVRCPPLTKEGRYLSDTCAIPHENKEILGAIPPSAILSRKGIARYRGGYLAPGR